MRPSHRRLVLLASVAVSLVVLALCVPPALAGSGWAFGSGDRAPAQTTGMSHQVTGSGMAPVSARLVPSRHLGRLATLQSLVVSSATGGAQDTKLRIRPGKSGHRPGRLHFSAWHRGRTYVVGGWLGPALALGVLLAAVVAAAILALRPRIGRVRLPQLVHVHGRHHGLHGGAH